MGILYNILFIFMGFCVFVCFLYLGQLPWHKAIFFNVANKV